jgi:hypothetical protein
VVSNKHGGVRSDADQEVASSSLVTIGQARRRFLHEEDQKEATDLKVPRMHARDSQRRENDRDLRWSHEVKDGGDGFCEYLEKLRM